MCSASAGRDRKSNGRELVRRRVTEEIFLEIRTIAGDLLVVMNFRTGDGWQI